MKTYALPARVAVGFVAASLVLSFAPLAVLADGPTNEPTSVISTTSAISVATVTPAIPATGGEATNQPLSWLLIAALLAILAGAGWWAYRLANGT